MSTSKSRLLTFLGNKFGELLSSFCCNKKIGTIFHRTNADVHVLLSNALGSSNTVTDTHHSQHSDTLNGSAHKLVRYLLSKAPEPGQSLVLDVDETVDEDDYDSVKMTASRSKFETYNNILAILNHTYLPLSC